MLTVIVTFMDIPSNVHGHSEPLRRNISKDK
jgi:hypothetical protein